MLRQQDGKALDPLLLARKSAAIQGLPALERILYSKSVRNQTTERARYSCRLGVAIAANIRNIVAEILREWTDQEGYGEYMLAPGFHNPFFRDGNAPPATLLSQFGINCEIIRDRQLRDAMGKTIEAAKPHLTPWRRSGLGLAFLRETYKAMADFYAFSGWPDYLADKEQWISRGILEAFAEADQLLAGVKNPLDLAVADKADREKLSGLWLKTRALQTLLGSQTAQALDITIGYTWVDGD